MMVGRCLTRNLLIDADDTLWESNLFFEEANAAFRALMTSLGHAPDEVDRAQAEAEQSLIATMGYGPHSYRGSLEQAYRHLQAGAGQPALDEVAAHCRALADVIFAPPMRLLPGVAEALRLLHASSLLVLVTKGDDRVQRDKLARSGLASLFDHVQVLVEKDEAAYHRLVVDLALEPARTYMIGNAPRSDINPAVAAGLHAIYIPHAHTWVAEHQAILQPERVTQVARFDDLPALFGAR